MGAANDISTARRWPMGWTVEHVAETTSTNDDLVGAAVAGSIGDRHVRVADHQTAGRGRLDRRWEAPPGTNLLASVHLLERGTDGGEARTPTEQMHRVGLAVLAAVESFLGDGAPPIGLKWPNDVLLDGRKLAGVLAQRSSGMAGIVVGFGVNVGWAPDGAARVGELADVAPLDLLVAVLEHHDALPVDASGLYRERLLTLGQQVRVELPGGDVVVGVAREVTTHGRLLVDGDDGTPYALDVGDVVHLRRAG